MPSKSRKAAMRQSNIRKRKKITKPNIKNFDLIQTDNVTELDDPSNQDSDYNNNISNPIAKKSTVINTKESTIVFNNNLFFELKRITLVSGLIAVLLGILTVTIS